MLLSEKLHSVCCVCLIVFVSNIGVQDVICFGIISEFGEELCFRIRKAVEVYGEILGALGAAGYNGAGHRVRKRVCLLGVSKGL